MLVILQHQRRLAQIELLYLMAISQKARKMVYLDSDFIVSGVARRVFQKFKLPSLLAFFVHVGL